MRSVSRRFTRHQTLSVDGLVAGLVRALLERHYEADDGSRLPELALQERMRMRSMMLKPLACRAILGAPAKERSGCGGAAARPGTHALLSQV